MTQPQDAPAALPPGEVGRGVLGRFTLLVHWALVLTALFVLSSLPATVPALLLGPETGNLPLLVLCAIPLAPVVAATLHAWRLRSRQPDDTSPARAFVRGWRLGALDAVRVTVPGALALAAISWSVVNIGGSGTPAGYGWVLLVIAAVLSLVLVQALVIATFFRFRTRDVWRLAAFHTFRLPLVTLALVALVVCLAALVRVTNDVVAVLAGALATGALLRYERPLLDAVETRFTTPTDEGR